MVDQPGIKPNWFSEIETPFHNLLSITLSHNFIVWLSNFIPLKLSQSWVSPLFLYREMTVLDLHSLGILAVLKITLKSFVSHFNPSSPKHFHTTIRIWSDPSAFPLFIFFKASLISSLVIWPHIRGSRCHSLHTLTLLWESSNTSPFRSLEKYLYHLSLISAASANTLSFLSLMYLTTPKSLVFLSLTLAGLKTSFSPSLVSSLWYNLFQDDTNFWRIDYGKIRHFKIY